MVDRSRSSALQGIRKCPEEAPHTLFVFRQQDKEGCVSVKPMVETLRFHVVYDCSVIQIFVNERTALSTRVYPATGTSTGIRPFMERASRGSFGGLEDRAWSLALWPLSLPA